MPVEDQDVGTVGAPRDPELGLGVVFAPTDVTTVDAKKHLTRMFIVFALFGLIVLTVSIPFILAACGICRTEKHWEFLHIVFPAEVGLLTAALAFYFDLRG
jgi:hypothetical protein